MTEPLPSDELNRKTVLDAFSQLESEVKIGQKNVIKSLSKFKAKITETQATSGPKKIQTQTSSWRQELSFPRPSEGCPAGTEINDCMKSPPVQCRCEPKGLATLLPTILKGEEMPPGSSWELTFPRPDQGCPAGKQRGHCRRSRPPKCFCEPDGVNKLYSLKGNHI